MSLRPRLPNHREPVVSAGTKRWSDRDAFLALTLFWIVSLVRVVGGILRKEVFEAEATLALMAVVGIPCFVFRRERRGAGGRHSQTFI